MKLTKTEVDNGYRYEISNDSKIITFYSENKEDTERLIEKSKELLN
jgi:uncharacterized protein YwgA